MNFIKGNIWFPLWLILLSYFSIAKQLKHWSGLFIVPSPPHSQYKPLSFPLLKSGLTLDCEWDTYTEIPLNSSNTQSIFTWTLLRVFMLHATVLRKYFASIYLKNKNLNWRHKLESLRDLPKIISTVSQEAGLKFTIHTSIVNSSLGIKPHCQ